MAVFISCKLYSHNLLLPDPTGDRLWAIEESRLNHPLSKRASDVGSEILAVDQDCGVRLS